MYDVYFSSPWKGWVLAKSGIWTTTDAGACWTRATIRDAQGQVISQAQIEAQGVEFYAMDIWDGVPVLQHTCTCPVSCPAPDFFIGLACAEPGLIFKTIDQGLNWQQVFDIRDLCACNNNGVNKFAVGPACQTDLCPPYPNCDDDPPGVFEAWDIDMSRNATSPLAIMVGGIGTGCGMIFASDDWGCTWKQEKHECDDGGPPTCPTGDCSGATPLTSGQAMKPHNSFRTLYGVGIFDADNSAIATGYHGQHVRRSPGAAGNGVWCDHSVFGDIFTFPDAVIFPLYGADADGGGLGTGKGWIVGSGGHVRRTTDGGQTWTEQGSRQSDYRVHDVYMFDEMEGWLSGQLFTISDTVDGGVTWIPRPGDYTQTFLQAVTFSDPFKGVTVGDSIAGSGGPKILWTPDNAALGWKTPTSITYVPGDVGDYDDKKLQEVDWNGDTGGPNAFKTFWAVGQAGLILKTTDGGDTWAQEVLTGSFLDPSDPDDYQDIDFQGVAFDVPGSGVFVGQRTDTTPKVGVAFLYQGGVWSDVSPPSTPAVRILTDVDVVGSASYAVGKKREGGANKGVILRFNGVTSRFEEVAQPYNIPACNIGTNPTGVQPLNEVEVITASKVFVAGQCGRLWVFDGSTWTQLKSQTDSHVWGMHFLLDSQGKVVGLLACHRRSNTQASVVGYEE